jgi:putative aldouronate transport system substrate-binding protein
LDNHGAGIQQMYVKTNMDGLWKIMTDKEANIWGFPSGADLTMYPIWIRVDWLEELNLEMPKDLDELETILKVFKEKDPSGTGETIPLACDLGGLKMCLAAGFIEGDYGVGNWMDSDGKIKPIEVNPGFKDFVAKMADWYKKGYIYKEAFATNRDRYIELLKQNKIGATAYWASLISINSPLLKRNVPDSRYEVVKTIKGPKGNIETPIAAGPSGMLLTKKSKNPDAAVKLINWACEDIENYLYCYGGMKDVNWKYVDKDNNLVEALNTDYIGEYLYFSAFAHTVQYMYNDPDSRFEFEYLRNNATAYDRVKKAFDHGILYDTAVLDEKIPNRGDIERMRNEEIIKFITGARQISEYDKFIEEMKKAGLDKWIDTYTELYKRETDK